MNILPNDLGRQYSLHAAEYETKALEVLRSGWYILGREVEQFEAEWAGYIGAKYCVGLASGLDALWISFRLLGIGRGDEVIVCSNAYIACVMGISMNGATPVFVEPDRYDNIDAEKIEAAITPRTKAILAVHLFGQACDMTRIMEIARSYGLKVVEDCAQSHGNHWQGQTVGTFGDVGCFSFYPTKGCGAFGDAGCIVTDDEALAQKFRVYRNYGSEKRYHNQVVGTNSRLDELQAGLLRVKLSHLPEFDAERRAIAGRYLAELHHPLIRLPEVRPGGQHLAPVRHPCGKGTGRPGRLSEREGHRHHHPLSHPAPPVRGLSVPGQKAGGLPHRRALRRRGAQPAHVQRHDRRRTDLCDRGHQRLGAVI